MSVRVHCENDECHHGILVPCTNDPSMDWLHETSGNSFCDVTDPASAVALAGSDDRMEASPDVPRLVKDAVAALRPTYDLIYIDRGQEGLQPSQIKAILDGVNPYESSEFRFVEDAESDSMHDGAMHVIDDDLFDDDDEREPIKELLDSKGELDELRFRIYERNRKDMISLLLGVTNNQLFRWSLFGLDDPNMPDVSADDETVTEAERLLREAGIPDSVDLHYLFAEASYGGTPYLVWYGDCEDAIRLAQPHRWDDKGNPVTDEQHGTVTFHDVHLMILDHYNGSGMVSDETFDVTVPWFAGRVSIDAARTGPGWSWTDTAGPHLPAFTGDFTRNLPETPEA